MLNLNESCTCGWTLDKEISGWFTLLGNHQGLLFAHSRPTIPLDCFVPEADKPNPCSYEVPPKASKYW